MRLTRVYIENVGGVRKLEIPCDGGLVIVSGANGTGKTSVLNAVRCVIEGGHQPELIGPYGKQATVELHFDNGWKFRREWNQKSYTLKGWSADGGKIDSPAKTIQALFESEYSLNPTGLINADPKDRVSFLHKALPLDFTAEEIARATGEAASRFAPVVRVEELDKIRQGRYEQRTVANVEWRKLKESRDKMAESLPDGDSLTLTWVDTEPGMDGQSKPQSAPIDPLDEVRTLERKLTQARDSLQSALSGWKADLDSLLNQLNREEKEEQEAIRLKYSTLRSDARVAAERLVTEERKPFDEYIERAAGELAAAQERAQQVAKLEGLRDAIRNVDKQMKHAQDEAVRLDNAVKNLDELKRKKLETLPIPGVEVRDGQLYVDGLNFETQLNTARQYLLSAQVAALTMKDFPFMIIDNTEAMDEENRRMFISGLAESGFQCVMAAVEDGKPLSVQTVPA